MLFAVPSGRTASGIGLPCEQPRGGRDSAVSSCGDNKLRSFVDQLSERRFSIEDACELVARRFDELADP